MSVSASNTTLSSDRLLVVLARQFVDELRYINYPREWAVEPLYRLVFPICSLLDLHTQKLGSVIDKAWKNSYPTLKPGNVNQLPTLYPDYFGKTRQSYLDEYEVYDYQLHTKITDRELAGELNNVLSPEQAHLTTLAIAIMDTFTTLRPDQENEHRTLERVCLALPPVYYWHELTGIGFELAEYADQWRNLAAADRQKLHNEIMARWGSATANNKIANR